MQRAASGVDTLLCNTNCQRTPNPSLSTSPNPASQPRKPPGRKKHGSMGLQSTKIRRQRGKTSREKGCSGDLEDAWVEDACRRRAAEARVHRHAHRHLRPHTRRQSPTSPTEAHASGGSLTWRSANNGRSHSTSAPLPCPGPSVSARPAIHCPRPNTHRSNTAVSLPRYPSTPAVHVANCPKGNTQHPSQRRETEMTPVTSGRRRRCRRWGWWESTLRMRERSSSASPADSSCHRTQPHPHHKDTPLPMSISRH